MNFEPDYRNIVQAARNQKPARLPLYEHIISIETMEAILQHSFGELWESPDQADQLEFFKHYCKFFKQMTYDTVSFEVAITRILPGSGAIMGGMKGPIQSRQDFQNYPWDSLPEKFWARADKQFSALQQTMPCGMAALGGPGNGVFELSEDLVGYEQLSYMLVDDPELFADLFKRIGDLMAEIWAEFLKRYGQAFAVCRMGDDLGFKTSTLLPPEIIRKHIIPQYQRIVQLVHDAGKPFLLHSCGCIFDVMEDCIETVKIDAKHSNEDQIADFEKWIEKYTDRIGLFGGIDVNILCTESPQTITEIAYEKAIKYRNMANGFALGSGNSIPEYVPVEGYLAMVEAAKKARQTENN
jgi:uroporphyrinogen decarboxylase